MGDPSDLRPERRSRVPPPPRGVERVKWLGPGILWALSSVGAGEVYYSARIGARYQYDLLWAGLLVVLFTWVIISEIGRYTVVSGETIIHGYQKMPGPRKWPAWFFLVTQCVDLAASTAGHAALAATILLLVLPGSVPLYGSILIVAAAAVVIFGAYSAVNRVTAVLASILLTAALATVAQVFPGVGTFFSGFVPAAPAELDLYFILPWVGFLLIHGAPWYSYWVGEQGFGGKLRHPLDELAPDEPLGASVQAREEGEHASEEETRGRLREWLTLSVQVAAVGSIIGALFAYIFVTLGAELLPGDAIPSGVEVGRQLGEGIEAAWGRLGFWLFVVTAAGSFWTTVLDVEDGAARLLADSTLILLPGRFVRATHGPDAEGEGPGLSLDDLPERGEEGGPWGYRARAHRRRAQAALERARAHEELARAEEERAGGNAAVEESHGAEPGTLGEWLLARRRLLSAYVAVLAGVVPIGLLLLVADPMRILAVAGIISAAQAPFFAFFTLWTNHRLLPEEFRPGWIWTTALSLSGLFFAAVSIFYFLGLLGWKPLS